jgi:hypothetical protein
MSLQIGLSPCRYDPDRETRRVCPMPDEQLDAFVTGVDEAPAANPRGV